MTSAANSTNRHECVPGTVDDAERRLDNKRAIEAALDLASKSQQRPWEQVVREYEEKQRQIARCYKKDRD